MSVSRLWLALIVALFCVPLFVGLGQGDAEVDEAIYSFAVDRIVESGSWVEPKSIPYDDRAFLEKPPLKFWIVAAPIRFGALPDNEFGRRFWDALFGAASFVYVFLIGVRLIGPVCGAVAVLVLFGHTPLLYVHGLRHNNMEAPLVLAYCGGVYHFLVWADDTRSRVRAGWHAVATGLCFMLGFMTKFVAVLFLPLVLGLASLIVPRYRRRALSEWRLWTAVAVMVAALTVPWFVWAHQQYGVFFWQSIFGESVVRRFTEFLDPNHVQPWHYYWSHMYEVLDDEGAVILSGTGLLVLAVQTARRRSADGLVVLLWLFLPLTLISFGTSKLYHYAYPFLPPGALAAGYGAALAVAVAPVPLERALRTAHDMLEAHAVTAVLLLRRPWMRRLATAVASLAGVVALYSVVFGPLRIAIDGTDVLRSSGIARPLLVVLLLGTLAGGTRAAARGVVAVLVISVLPVVAYRTSLGRLYAAEQPMRDARDCLAQVQSTLADPTRGLYVDAPPEEIPHPVYYHFRNLRPWTWAPSPSPDALTTYLDDPAQWRPVLVWEPTYQQFRYNPASQPRASPAMVVFEDVVNDLFLLLPGPYSACSAEAAAVRR